MRRWTKIILTAVLVFSLWGQHTRVAQAQDEQRIYYTALGDSIAKGYSMKGAEAEITPYSDLVSQHIQEQEGRAVSCENFAKNGVSTVGLNQRILPEEEVIASLQKADIITVTIGANDLLNEFKRGCQEILGTDEKFRSAYDGLDALQSAIGRNPLILIKVVDALNNWDYDKFEAEWAAALSTIAEHKKESAQLIVTNIYNPAAKFELPGTMNMVVESIIKNMNQVMLNYQDIYGYEVVDLFESSVQDHVQADGLHPDQEGQNIIAGLVLEKIQPLKEAQETAAKVQTKAVDREEVEAVIAKKKAAQKQKKRLRKMGVAVLAAGVCYAGVTKYRRHKKKAAEKKAAV